MRSVFKKLANDLPAFNSFLSPASLIDCASSRDDDLLHGDILAGAVRRLGHGRHIQVVDDADDERADRELLLLEDLTHAVAFAHHQDEVARAIAAAEIIDDPAAKFVPQWKDDSRKSKITVRHLGSHTSGLSDSTTEGVKHEEQPGWMGDFWKRLDPPHGRVGCGRVAEPEVDHEPIRQCGGEQGGQPVPLGNGPDLLEAALRIVVARHQETLLGHLDEPPGREHRADIGAFPERDTNRPGSHRYAGPMTRNARLSFGCRWMGHVATSS